MGRRREPIQIHLTPDQQQSIQRASGQFAHILEITPDSTDESGGEGRSVQFRWRLSSSTGIPRQDWVPDEKTPDSTPNEESSAEQ